MARRRTHQGWPHGCSSAWFLVAEAPSGRGGLGESHHNDGGWRGCMVWPGNEGRRQRPYVLDGRVFWSGEKKNYSLGELWWRLAEVRALFIGPGAAR
jgi:hypothetical protein